jgi:mRNA-degrading endonuclease RelE of RelBE toxin-antitoxin system
MPRSPTRIFSPYRFTFSPDAWRKIGRIPTPEFQALQAALEEIAATFTEPRPAGETAAKELRAQVAGMEIVYHRDDEHQILTLVDFQLINSKK